MTRDPMFSGGGLPALPFAGRSGAMGSSASHERRDREDGDGTTTYRQDRVIEELRMAGVFGRTWKEIGEKFGWHHGQATGALSPLHKTGHIAALDGETRDGCSIYVHPDHIAGRPVRAPGQSKSTTLQALVDAQEEELKAARALIAQLEQESEARVNEVLEAAKMEYLAPLAAARNEASAARDEASGLRASLTAMQTDLRAAEEQNVAHRTWRRLATLEPEVQQVIETLERRIEESGRGDDETAPVKIGTLKTILAANRPLRVRLGHVTGE